MALIAFVRLIVGSLAACGAASPPPREVAAPPEIDPRAVVLEGWREATLAPFSLTAEVACASVAPQGRELCRDRRAMKVTGLAFRGDVPVISGERCVDPAGKCDMSGRDWEQVVREYRDGAWHDLYNERDAYRASVRGLQSVGTELYLIKSPASLRRHTATGWQSVGGERFVPLENTVVMLPVVAFDGAGAPTVVWWDNDPALARLRRQQRLVPDVGLSASQLVGGKWQWLGPRAFASGGAAALAVSKRGVPYVLDFDDSGAPFPTDPKVARPPLGLRVLRFVDGVWGPLGGPLGLPYVSASFVITTVGEVPYVLYDWSDTTDHSGGTPREHLEVRKWDGTQWIQVGSLPLAGVMSQPTLASDGQGNLYLAYVDPVDARVFRLEGDRWRELGRIHGVNGGLDLAFDAADTPHVAIALQGRDEAPRPVLLRLDRP